MIKFLPIRIDKAKNKFENQQYLPFILNLFHKYKDILIDDYYPIDNIDLIMHIIDEINELYPWFLICMIDDIPIGVVWISHWHGNEQNYHSCQVHSYVDKKYWGKPTIKVLNELFDLLFNKVGVKRIQMEIPEFNHKACAFAVRGGFIKEGVVRCATVKDGKPVNNVLFSKLKNEWEKKDS